MIEENKPGDIKRIAMWSGPRNISTAMMRSFENRPDAIVWDEPFYAAYLHETGLAHPMRDEVIADGEQDWRAVVNRIVGHQPDDASVFYQKHMTHHMVPGFDRSWLNDVTNCFLIRSPEAVLASYSVKRADITLRDIGFVEQAEIFDLISDHIGAAPPVVEADDVLNDPRGILSALCRSCDIEFHEQMLSWPAGRRNSDGIWAAHWYGAVEQSTGFAPPSRKEPIVLDDNLKSIADEARVHYEKLRRFRMTPAET